MKKIKDQFERLTLGEKWWAVFGTLAVLVAFVLLVPVFAASAYTETRDNLLNCGNYTVLEYEQKTVPKRCQP